MHICIDVSIYVYIYIYIYIYSLIYLFLSGEVFLSDALRKMRVGDVIKLGEAPCGFSKSFPRNMIGV